MAEPKAHICVGPHIIWPQGRFMNYKNLCPKYYWIQREDAYRLELKIEIEDGHEVS